MDTPDRNQISTPISKFEDSPVFNYINSLSPIKPVKSVHITQAFHSLNFASIPSIFTSPHVSSNKESRFSRRYHFADPSKSGLSDNKNEGNTSAGVSEVVQPSECSADQQGCFAPEHSIREVNVEPPTENLNLAIELPRTLRYDCGSPDGDLMPGNDTKTNPVPEMAVTPVSLVQFVQEVSEERCQSFETEAELQEMHQAEQNKEEGAGCDWENLISDTADLLIFYSSTDMEVSKGHDQNLVDPETTSFTSLMSKLPQENTNDLHKTQPVGPFGSREQHKMEDPTAQPRELEQKETDQTKNILSATFLNKQVVSDPIEKMDDKAGSSISFSCKPHPANQRGMRRRCLVFEISGAHKKKLANDSNSSSSVSPQSDGKNASDEKQLVPVKPGSRSSPCILPGIGLHLNALATTSKDCRIVKHESLPSGRQLISMPSSIASFHSLTSGSNSLKSMTLNSLEKDTGLADNEAQAMQDASQVSAFGVNEEFNQTSPKKKRRRLEHVGENDACKRCNCKKSKCLKLYCECFAAGVYCIEPCSCQECFNKPIHEDTVLATRKQIESRNPLAFAPKVIRSSESIPETGEDLNKTPASARHKRGCNCKKSSCLKKYCECYQGGVGCSINCRCDGCKNAFGRKDGFASMGMEEAEPEEEEKETCEKNGVDIGVHNNEILKNEEQYSDSVLPITPSFQMCRPSEQLPFASSGKPPRSSVCSIGSSPQLHTSQRLGKPDLLHPQPKFERHFQVIPEDDTPEILKGDCSPISGVKMSSPNCKRVSPPHLGLSPNRRSGRKLILQSIPSFPSLTPHHESNNFPLKFS
ncbi:PREDICTED: CRC domain-containing protein TSO1-like [Nelumbo nucifera]|uniref:CRC domain-containing protein TSO1-like n=2 Tax=Nelumbo nucifera TaxID=4432 RepID=A0A1U7ZX79_NELNU|nr:PREDICTED: CRC domain-containing protein TSO1-like [Nelumbo nucifera]XP_010259115.1 PREDICTED: CRC domain-containing protein TSO1-like [Nelumbo nucifera]DAD47919.1 TPA_asm: hypothetical protein HUJ06_017856 [Nelumbo nucifera]